MLHLQVLLAFVLLGMFSRCSSFAPRPTARLSLARSFWPFDKQEAPIGVAIIDAIQSQNEGTVKSALATGGSTIVNGVDPVSGNNAMHIIAKKGHYKYPPDNIPKLLVTNGINVNARNGRGETALEISLLSGWQVVTVMIIMIIVMII